MNEESTWNPILQIWIMLIYKEFVEMALENRPNKI